MYTPNKIFSLFLCSNQPKKPINDIEMTENKSENENNHEVLIRSDDEPDVINKHVMSNNEMNENITLINSESDMGEWTITQNL